MDDDSLKALLQSAGQISGHDQSDPRGTMAILLSETVKYRDRLKAETGVVLTVDDTRKAINALERYLISDSLPSDITPTQRELAQIWIERLTLLGH